MLRSVAISLAVLVAAAVPHTGASAGPDYGKRYIGSYHSKAGCHEAGRKGEREHRWRKHTCVRTIGDHIGTWDLWVE